MEGGNSLRPSPLPAVLGLHLKCPGRGWRQNKALSQARCWEQEEMSPHQHFSLWQELLPLALPHCVWMQQTKRKGG